jgi:hypothetical protein
MTKKAGVEDGNVRPKYFKFNDHLKVNPAPETFSN